MEKLDNTYVFQTDSEFVRGVYETNNNYLIEHSEDGDADTCAIYFSSNNIYYPNSEEIFTKRIVNRNFYEWYHTRINKASKHIFLRDVFKQWYLAGINNTINSPEKLMDFLKQEIKGYTTIVTLGSSAGGYAAILYGSLIGAQTVLAFNPQFEITSLLKRSTESINPLIFRLRNERNTYYDIVPFINDKTEIFYFYSNHSPWDKEQYEYVKPMHNLYRISFQSSHHGIPFLKAALPVVLNTSMKDLKKWANKSHNPIAFTIKRIGLCKTVNGFISQIYHAYKKRK